MVEKGLTKEFDKFPSYGVGQSVWRSTEFMYCLKDLKCAQLLKVA